MREKQDFHENMIRIQDYFGPIQLLPFRKVAEFCGTDYRILQNDKTFPLKKVARRYYVSAVSLARWLS